MPLIDALPPPQQVEFSVMQETRAVHDVAGLSFADYEADGTPVWVVLRTVPTEESGSATLPGGHIKAETGNLVVPPGAEMVIVKEGSWQLLAAAQSTAPTRGTYSWQEPIRRGTRGFDPENVYSPFEYGATLICRLDPNGTGGDRFRGQRVIFPDWVDAVPEAALATKAGVTPEGGRVPSNGRTVEEQIRQSNPLLAVFALREALRAGMIAPAAGRDLLVAARPHRIATFVFLMLTASLPESRAAWFEQVVQATNEQSRPDELYGFALGAFAMTLGQHSDPAIGHRGKEVLAAVKRRLETLKIPGPAPPRLQFMFERLLTDGIDRRGG
jgi:hypothetical protein